MRGVRVGFAFVALGIVAGSPPANLVPGESPSAPSQGTLADAEVRLALQAEAAGDSDGRLAHLQKALELDPQHPTALGLIGLVSDSSQPLAPEDVSRTTKGDAVLAGVLGEYNQRRAEAAQTVEEQWDLAVWCERTGLKSEAIAHFTAVTRLDPSHREAWHRLGYQMYDGRWMTPAEIRAEKLELEAQDAANRSWGPKLVALKKALHDEDRRDEAKRTLDEIRDPRAIPAVWGVLASGGPVDQTWAVRVLGHIDAPEAAHRLAVLALDASSPFVRKVALDRLSRFDPGTYVGLLVNRLRDTTPVSVVPVQGPDAPGELWVESPDVKTRWLYVVDASGSSAAGAGVGTGTPRVSFSRSSRRAGLTPTFGNREQPAPEGVELAVAETQRQLDADARSLQIANATIQETNQRVVAALRRFTGIDLGPDREQWTKWWSGQLGYVYESPKPPPEPKPTETRIASSTTIPAPRPVAVFPARVAHHSCFAAGTLVHTKLGKQAIETIRVGDQVLSQDTTTGALGYQPVIAVFHNPPSATVRINFAEEEVVATGIHRFWKVGRGWTMARDLKPGDAVRAVGGVREVVSVSPDQVRAVFNLEVAVNQDYLVGKSGVLVHDHSLVRPTFRPFDSAPQQRSAHAGRPAGKPSKSAVER